MRLCAISVDLDEIPNYHAIHGLAPPVAPGATAVYDVALPRLYDWAVAEGVPLTLFTIGEDVARAENSAQLRIAVAKGHEIGNHSFAHLYDLTRQDRDEMQRQVEGGAGAIRDAVGVTPTGFRAPGYTFTDALHGVLLDSGVAYDSSVFPCAPYYLAKAAVLLGMRIRGRTSRSVLDTPQVLRAPTRPYRVGRPYWKRGHGILELPVQVTRGLRLPFIGTTITLAGPDWARRLARLVLGEPLVNLELHGMDVLDAEDGLSALEGHQTDVSIRHLRKLEALSAVIGVLRREGYAFVRLDEAAARFA
jgi:peptidoglycan/xylan/chitin deacetylase (PgdA/CDA1 family)